MKRVIILHQPWRSKKNCVQIVTSTTPSFIHTFNALKPKVMARAPAAFLGHVTLEAPS